MSKANLQQQSGSNNPKTAVVWHFNYSRITRLLCIDFVKNPE